MSLFITTVEDIHKEIENRFSDTSGPVERRPEYQAPHDDFAPKTDPDFRRQKDMDELDMIEHRFNAGIKKPGDQFPGDPKKLSNYPTSSVVKTVDSNGRKIDIVKKPDGKHFLVHKGEQVGSEFLNIQDAERAAKESHRWLSKGKDMDFNSEVEKRMFGQKITGQEIEKQNQDEPDQKKKLEGEQSGGIHIDIDSHNEKELSFEEKVEKKLASIKIVPHPKDVADLTPEEIKKIKQRFEDAKKPSSGKPQERDVQDEWGHGYSGAKKKMSLEEKVEKKLALGIKVIENKNNVSVNEIDGKFLVIVDRTPAVASQYGIKLKESFPSEAEAKADAQKKRDIMNRLPPGAK